MERRDFLSGAAGAGLGMSLTGHQAAAQGAIAPGGLLAPPEALAALKHSPMMNLERAHKVLAEEGLDGLIMAEDINFYHLCNFFPSPGRMGTPNTCIGLLSADENRQPGMVVHQFIHFYVAPQWGVEVDYETFPYGGIKDMDAYLEAENRFAEEPEAISSSNFRVGDEGLVTERQRNRWRVRDEALEDNGLSAGIEWALIKAAKAYGFDKGRVGVDHPMIAAILNEAGFSATYVPAGNVIKKIRIVRSDVEIQMMRLAAQQNADAALAAANKVVPGMSFRELRAQYFAEAALRGMQGVFMVIDSASADPFHDTIREGQGFSIDCVSHFMHFHGDFARTIFVGEPPAILKRATEASAAGWDSVREILKPGVSYSEIRAAGREGMKKKGYGDFVVSYTPHSVGLYHTDEPSRDDAPFALKDDIVLEEGMILSVDCPVLMDGIGGTVHLEDLTLITKDGSEQINDIDHRVVMV